MKSFLNLGRILKPNTRFAKFSWGVVALFLLWNLASRVFGLKGYPRWNLLLNFTLLVVIIRYVFKGVRWGLAGLLWRLRRRLIITYVLIGVVPVFLLFSIFIILGYFTFGQLASYFIYEEIEHRSSNLKTAVYSIADHGLDLWPTSAESPVQAWSQPLNASLRSVDSNFSSLTLDAQSGSNRVGLEFKEGRWMPRPFSPKPAWMTKNESGLFEEQSEMFIAAVFVRQESTSSQWLLARAPLDAKLFQTISDQEQVTLRMVDLIPVEKDTSPGIKLRINDQTFLQRPHTETPSRYSNPLRWYDFSIHIPLFLKAPRQWNSGKELGNIQPMYLMLETTWLRLARRLFSVGLIGEENIFVYLLVFVSVFFLLIEFIALISSVLLTRTITGAVYNLDEGAQHIMRGDFSHRIRVKARDQLSSLAETFNSMTASIERLLKEQTEKQRLESELAIAVEVQKQLFPREAPHFRKLRIAGMCNPARIVSGDYYDYLLIAPMTVGLALGDVSGKGVSAALLMASLQGALRSQAGLIHLAGEAAARRPEDGSVRGLQVASSQVAKVAAVLNHQLYQNTPTEKYVTFFYGVYDERTSEFAYTNAGHLPPLVFTGNGVERLEAGGTVLGLIPEAEYEQQTIRLAPGDVLVAYTDGITEAENAFDEQFGEKRLIQVVEQSLSKSPESIVADILKAVGQWVESGEAQDDMTLIVAKAV